MKVLIAIVAILSMAVAARGNAAPIEPLVDFLAPQGCAIGPATRSLAKDAGFGEAAIDALVARADGEAGTVRTGGWIVLPPGLCRIRPPEARSAIRLGDPEVTSLTSRIDPRAEPADRGCFLAGPPLVDRVRETRGWDREKANREYLRFLSENLRAGDLTFYRDDPLSTPIGFQILTDECAEVPAIAQIRHSQAVRDREFDALIRADASNVACGRDDSPSYRFMDLVRKRTGEENRNAWLFFEVRMMVIGGDWYEGTTAARRGLPRPPLCQFG